MRVGHERREFILDAEELVHRIVVPLIFFSLDLAREEPIEDVSGKPLRWRLPIERVGVQVREILANPIENTLLMRG